MTLGDGLWAPRHHSGGCHRRREPRVSAITSQAALFQTHFHLTGHLLSFKEDAFLKPRFGNHEKPLLFGSQNSSAEQTASRVVQPPRAGPSVRWSERRWGRGAVVTRPTWCHARLHAHPGNLPSCPRPHRPAFSSLASYNEDEKEDDAKAGKTHSSLR